jgi:hypothetical protein
MFLALSESMAFFMSSFVFAQGNDKFWSNFSNTVLAKPKYAMVLLMLLLSNALDASLNNRLTSSVGEVLDEFCAKMGLNALEKPFGEKE